MITVDEALALIERHVRPAPPRLSAEPEAVGLVLAEDVASDIDSPPHDKSIVDGYAVRSADLAGGETRLAIVEEVVAGAVPTRAVTPGDAVRIMTGAPVPDGADAVVMVEKTEAVPSTDGRLGQVIVRAAGVPPGQNILPRAAALRRGEVVLRAGHRLRPIEIGLLCEVGRAQVLAVPRPRVAVLSTGNELVAPHEKPAAGQIRNSNGPMLLACVARAGGVPVDLGIGRDERDALRRLIGFGLQADVLVLSGGVSAGVLDLVPELLAEAGVEQVFHKVRIKPGKPLWFGVLRGEPCDKLVFGLPGNPVSSLVGFEVFVRPALARWSGRAFTGLAREAGTLASEFVHRGERATFFPALGERSPDGLSVRPLDWKGSADLRGLAGADCLIHFPTGDRTFAAGETVDVYKLE